MPRGVGARRVDTVQQRARFFGYKRSYIGYCRIFLEPEVASAFRRYVQHEEDIRTQLQQLQQNGESLDDLRRVFLLPQGMYATRESIIDVDYVIARFSDGWFYPRAPHDSPNSGESNRESTLAFFNKLELVENEGHEDRTEIQRHRIATGIPLREAYEQLLMGLRFSRLSDAQNFLGVLVIVRNYLRDNPEAACTLYEMSGGLARERTINSDGEIAQLLQGAAPVNPPERRGEIYPGDREMHSDDEITIQVHNLDLRSEAGVIEDVVNIAVWIPPGAAGDVLIQEQGGVPADE